MKLSIDEARRMIASGKPAVIYAFNRRGRGVVVIELEQPLKLLDDLKPFYQRAMQTRKLSARGLGCTTGQHLRLMRAMERAGLIHRAGKGHTARWVK